MFDKDIALATMKKYKEVIPWCCFIPFSLRRSHVPQFHNRAHLPLIDFMDETEQDVWSKITVKELIDLKLKGIFKCMGFYTGEKAGVTLIDLDSKDAREPLEEYVGQSIEEMCGFILDTTKGYHLYFSYSPLVETMHHPMFTIRDKPRVALDVKNGGYFGMSVGIPGYNERNYSIHGNLEDIHLKPMPEKIAGYLTELAPVYETIGDGHCITNNDEDIKSYEERMYKTKWY